MDDGWVGGGGLYDVDMSIEDALQILETATTNFERSDADDTCGPAQAVSPPSKMCARYAVRAPA
jgi:hypothetical protein